MNLKKFLFAGVFAVVSVSFIACHMGPNDADIKASVEERLKADPKITNPAIDVKDGVVTISGECPDEATRVNCENEAKDVKGVKSVVNNCTVTAPPAAPAPVAMTPDEMLKASVNAAIANYPGVKAEVNDSVVTLTGDIKKEDLTKLMQAVNDLKPKKVKNNMNIIK